MIAAVKKAYKPKDKPKFSEEEQDRIKPMEEVGIKNMGFLKKLYAKNPEVMFIDDFVHEDPILGYLSTGSFMLDAAVAFPRGLGIPYPSIIEIVGLESSAKTATACRILASLQQLGGWVFFQDCESNLTQDYGAMSGLNLDAAHFGYQQCETIEDAMESQIKLIDYHFAHSPRVPLGICLDSVASTSTKKDKEGKGNIAQHAKIIRKALRDDIARAITGRPCILIYCNHLTSTIGAAPGMPAYESFGGSGLKFHSRVRIQLMRKEKLKPQDKTMDPIGIRVKANIIKNKIAAPYRNVEFDFLFGHGTEDYFPVFNFLEKFKALERSGGEKGRLVWKDVKYFNNQFRQFMMEHPADWKEMQKIALGVMREKWPRSALFLPPVEDIEEEVTKVNDTLVTPKERGMKLSIPSMTSSKAILRPSKQLLLINPKTGEVSSTRDV